MIVPPAVLLYLALFLQLLADFSQRRTFLATGALRLLPLAILTSIHPAAAINSEEAAELLWTGRSAATEFLVWVGLLTVARLCPRGHEWKLNPHGTRCVTLLSRYEDVESEDENGNPKVKREFCRAASTWRTPGGFCQALPSRGFTPDKFVKTLFWFSEGESLRRCKKEACISDKVLARIVNALRRIMRWDLERSWAAEPKLGGWGNIVAIDETYWRKPKVNRAGFRGRFLRTQKVCVLGLCEISMETRTCTGRVRLIQIAGPTKACIREQVLRHVELGSLVFTDQHKSYLWLTEAGYVHRSVNHSRREFSRIERIYGQPVNVTTNSAEGLFGRVKEFSRAKQRKKYRGGVMVSFSQNFCGGKKELAGILAGTGPPFFPSAS